MTASDWAIVCATLLGPVLAVQAQKWVERATESRRRRRWIFDTVMANRATRLADENVKALNLIDLEFRRRRIPSSRDRAVIEAWHELFGELTQGHFFDVHVDRCFTCKHAIQIVKDSKLCDLAFTMPLSDNRCRVAIARR